MWQKFVYGCSAGFAVSVVYECGGAVLGWYSKLLFQITGFVGRRSWGGFILWNMVRHWRWLSLRGCQKACSYFNFVMWASRVLGRNISGLAVVNALDLGGRFWLTRAAVWYRNGVLAVVVTDLRFGKNSRCLMIHVVECHLVQVNRWRDSAIILVHAPLSS